MHYAVNGLSVAREAGRQGPLVLVDAAPEPAEFRVMESEMVVVASIVSVPVVLKSNGARNSYRQDEPLRSKDQTRKGGRTGAAGGQAG